jgi:hypothetical protein
MEYDPAIALNLAEVLPIHRRPKQIDFKNQLHINSFCTKVMLTIPKEQMTSEIEGLEQMSTLLSGMEKECSNHSIKIVKWFDHLAILPTVEEAITVNKKFSVVGRKLHCLAPTLVVIRKWHRRCFLLLRAIRQGSWLRVRTLASKLIASRKLVEDTEYDPDLEMDISSCFGGIQPLNLPPSGDTDAEWAEWVTDLEKIVEQLASKLQGRYRKNQRLKTWEWAKKREETYKSGQCKQQLRRDLGEPLRGGLLSSIETVQESSVNDEGIASTRPACTVEEPEEVKEALAANFSKWFGKGRRKWFIDKQIWLKCEGATLRKKIASGALEELEVLGSDDACLHSLTQLSTLTDNEKEGIREIPIRCWKVVKAARYKEVGGVAVHIHTADTLNQNEAHTWDQWKLLWDRKKAGTTPGCSGISTTMMKIMQKRVRNEKGEVQESPLIWLSDLIRRWSNLAIKHGVFPDVYV